MSARIVPCDSCGSPISDADMESGQAVTLLGKKYCGGCKAEAIQNVSLDDLSGGAPAPVRKVAPPAKPAPARPAPARAERKAPIRKPAPVVATPSRTPLIASAAGVVVLLCAGGAFLAFREPAPAPSTPVQA